jgi:hypothetical protein
MSLEKEKLIKANEILRKMANGINPLNGEPIEEGSFLNDPRLIRCLYFIEDVLNRVIDGQLRTSANKLDTFAITVDEKRRIELPPGRIGVNEFAKCVNRVINLNKSKKMSGLELNKRLKRMGVLEEEVLADGKTRTVAGANSPEYGIETEKRSHNGNDYDMILFNDLGKRYLLDNLEVIMAFEIDAVPAPG